MRLIDIDVYCATICRCNRRLCDREKCPIWNAPTAYDINKVVREIRERSREYNSGVRLHGKPEQMLTDEAVEIVKQGNVVNDDYGDNRWIDARYEVPSTNRYILLSFSNIPMPAIGRYELDENGGAFYIEDEDESCVTFGAFVNAWMELPERYKG